MSLFWERRKAAVAAEAQAEEEAHQAALLAELEEAQAEKSDEELLEELGLPDPYTLTEGDDFKQFLTEAVPARLKTRALRRLWRVNPVLANLDGLLDYGEDFTDSAMVVENLQTAYQVGKGMLKHVEELARQAEEAERGEDIEEDAPELVAEAEVTATEQVEPEPSEPEGAVVEDAQLAVEDDADIIEHAAARPARRMVFTFDAEGAG